MQIARAVLPAYSNCLMGQQHRVTVKRKRRKAYNERQRVAAAAKAPRRAPAAKTRAKKTTAVKPSAEKASAEKVSAEKVSAEKAPAENAS